MLFDPLDRRDVSLKTRPPATLDCFVWTVRAIIGLDSRYDNAMAGSREHHKEYSLFFSQRFSLTVSSVWQVSFFHTNDKHPVELLPLTGMRIEKM